MSLRSLFEEELKPVRSTLDSWVESLNAQDQGDVLEFAAHPGLSHQAFLRIVRGKGVRVSKDSVSEWRRAHGFPRG